MPSRESDPRWIRRAQPLNHPLPVTLRWVADLPVEVQPRALLHQFPRVANSIARAWDDAEALRAYFDSLLVDRRGGRQGFPPDVLSELLTLHDFMDRRFGYT